MGFLNLAKSLIIVRHKDADAFVLIWITYTRQIKDSFVTIDVILIQSTDCELNFPEFLINDL